MSYGSRANLTMGRNLKQTVYTLVDTAQGPTHLADHLAQHGKTSAEDVENWDTGSPSAETAIKEHRTRDIPTREKGENPRRLVKLELMTTTLTWWVLQLSCKHHLTVEPMTTTVTRWCCNCPASTISQ